ncbi:hypothetical protein [Microcoleus sp. F4-D5]|uniref:hypothetical protein n=1 Tax=Microcoleus sp. F4-D5 TaxID=2818760 RepID=UPI002FD72D0B
MESNNRFSQEVPSDLSQIAASEPENSSAEELDELELEAIAGGCSDAADRDRAAGIRVITTNSPRPNIDFGLVSMDLIEAATRAFGKR